MGSRVSAKVLELLWERAASLRPDHSSAGSVCNPGRLRELGFLQAGQTGTPNEGWVQSRKSHSSQGSLCPGSSTPCKDRLENVQPEQNNMSHLPPPVATVLTSPFPEWDDGFGGKATQGHTCRTWHWGSLLLQGHTCRTWRWSSLPTQGQLTS